MLALSMALQYIDKQALPAASILGIIQDLVGVTQRPCCSCNNLTYPKNLTGKDYSWTNSVFYFGYLAFTYLIPYLMVKFPIGKVLSFTL